MALTGLSIATIRIRDNRDDTAFLIQTSAKYANEVYFKHLTGASLPQATAALTYVRGFFVVLSSLLAHAVQGLLLHSCIPLYRREWALE